MKVTHRQINEFHPAVQQLVNEYEYDLEAAIEAVKLYGNVDEAMDYLIRKEADNGEDKIPEFEPILNDSEALNEE